MEQKYKKGDRVKVLVGHRLWSNDPLFKAGKHIGGNEWDINPELTEDIATVEYTYGERSETDGRFSKGDSGYKDYSLKFDKYGSISWFREEDIVLVELAPNPFEKECQAIYNQAIDHATYIVKGMGAGIDAEVITSIVDRLSTLKK